MFCLPHEGKGKQTKPDNVGGDTLYDNGVAELQKILQMCIFVLIWLAIEWASLHHVNEARFDLGVHIPDIDVGFSGHIVGGGDRELAESLFSHSLKNEWCFRKWVPVLGG